MIHSVQLGGATAVCVAGRKERMGMRCGPGLSVVHRVRGGLEVGSPGDPGSPLLTRTMSFGRGRWPRSPHRDLARQRGTTRTPGRVPGDHRHLRRHRPRPGDEPGHRRVAQCPPLGRPRDRRRRGQPARLHYRQGPRLFRPGRLARIFHHDSAAPAQPPCLPAGRPQLLAGSSSESSTGVGAGFTGDPRSRPYGPGSPKGFGSYRGPARIYVCWHGLATIRGEKCGLAPRGPRAGIRTPWVAWRGHRWHRRAPGR